MPFRNLLNTPTTGKAEVLKTLQYLVDLPGRAGTGSTVEEIAEALQPLGRYHGPDNTDVQTVLTALEGLSPPLAAHTSGKYRLTRDGVLAARRARPYAVRT